METCFDVALVGYGPVGQALAAGLAQLGHRVAVLERLPALHRQPRAVGFDHETARILQSLGIAASLSEFTVPVTRYDWRNADGTVLKTFTGLDRVALSGWPDKVTFHQPGLEAALDARVRSFGSQVEICQGWEVIAAEERDDHVVIQARTANGNKDTQRTIRARFVVGCDGAGSFIRRAMGSHYETLGFSADWLVVDIRPKEPAAWDAQMIQVCDPRRPTTLVASGPGRRRLEFMLLEGESKDAMNVPDVVWKLLENRGWRPDNAHLERHAVYTFGACIASPWRSGRLLLAGDAAHLTPPFAGQGLCAGLRDAAALQWRLHYVLTGMAKDSILDSYAGEREPHVRSFTNFSMALGNIICVLEPADAARRDAQLLGADASAEDRYPDPLLGPSCLVNAGDPHAGSLSLQARIRVRGREGRFDDIVGSGFILLGLDHEPKAELDAAAIEFAQWLGIRLVGIGASTEIEDIEGAYRAWFETLESRAVLIRPDFYLFGAGDALDLMHNLQKADVWNDRCELSDGQAVARASQAE